MVATCTLGATYTIYAFVSYLIMYSCSITCKYLFVVSTPNVGGGGIDKLIAQDTQPCTHDALHMQACLACVHYYV